MFASLSHYVQNNKVFFVLRDLLGDAPTKADYQALVSATAEAFITLQLLVERMPPDPPLDSTSEGDSESEGDAENEAVEESQSDTSGESSDDVLPA